MDADRLERGPTGGMAPGGGREATPGAVAQAARVLDQAEARLRRWDTPLEAALLAVVDRRWTDEVATMAVQLRPDGIATLLANPGFVIEVGADGTAFVLCHEALHLLFAHLRHDGARDDAWRLACEVVINHWVQRATGQPLPRSMRTGEQVGIDPRAVHRDHLAAGAAPVTYDAFVLTDTDCARYLRATPGTTTETSADVCVHHDGDSTEVVDGDAVERVLEAAVARAGDGDELLRQRLLGLEELTPDAPVWGRTGVSELRATTQRLGSTRLWQAQLAHVLGQTLRPRVEVRYDRKIGWWDAELLAEVGLHLDPGVGMPLLPGTVTDHQRQVAIYLDTSGSVPAEVVDAAAATVGRIPDTLAHWRSFDHEVHPFEPGEPLVGGGGTSFHVVAEDAAALAAGLDERLDAVVVLTDGYAEPITPPDAQRWIWLIVAGGDTWPADRGMRTVRVPDHLGE